MLGPRSVQQFAIGGPDSAIRRRSTSGQEIRQFRAAILPQRVLLPFHKPSSRATGPLPFSLSRPLDPSSLIGSRGALIAGADAPIVDRSRASLGGLRPCGLAPCGPLAAWPHPPSHLSSWALPRCAQVPASPHGSETMLKEQHHHAKIDGQFPFGVSQRSRYPHSQASGGVTILRVGAHTARRHKAQGVAHSTGCCAPNTLGCA